MQDTSNKKAQKLEEIISNIDETQEFIAKDFSYYYEELQPDLEKTFNYEQKNAVKSILRRATKTPSKKIIDFRTSFWFFKKLYIVVVIGEKKDKAKLGTNYEDKISLIRIGLKTIIYLIQFTILLVFFLFILYLVKSFLGIDLDPNAHLKDYIWGETQEK